ncbi:asparaginase [Variovorax arabinosiphilus]|uniref:asparaginase n=1 Tax=Variovorax arabinosiphilus TaxID=3053498 RepID=UPI002577ACF8|nr:MULTISPECIES: asparaginase [unclassified Variovorax]MDM0119112.1 asparaginase [Variovorax sp. J2L1-78]MDM0129538.1 asparaginase [Variovorax sp. J2L1-63]MDM0232676.1 asparaginase [Variovorax sp. J2R1-6]
MVNKSNPGALGVLVLGTGGTIAGRAASAADNVGYTAGEVGVDVLLQGLDPPPGLPVWAEQVAQLDSKDMDFEVWQALAARCAEALARDDVGGLVITHGTDTLEETAFFLQSVLSPVKPVVLTCAMRPASALVPDGPQNLRDAISLAAWPGATGVTVVCAGAVHRSLDVQKVHTYRLDAFDSGDAGPLGYMEEGALRALRAWPEPQGASAARLDAVIATEPFAWPRVEILTSHAGAQGLLIDALVQARRSGGAHAVDGLVLAATGNGTLHHTIETAALRAQAAGIAVLRATRCAQGRIVGTSGAAIRDAGALTPVKARVALILELLVARAH